MQRLFLDIIPFKSYADAPGPSKQISLEKIQVEILIALGRYIPPPETIPPGRRGPVILAYDTTFEFLEILNKFLRGESSAAALVPLDHFLVMQPFDRTRVKLFIQYNVAIVPEHNQTPSFIISFEELSREILLFAINVYEYFLEVDPSLESDLEMLCNAIDKTKTAVEEYLGIENLLRFPAEDEKED